ncbi:hypothetical protein LIA77_09020 [Sarocladium implicatum]|nr:hypothetical protein LIA77_09020 [Sarocladium implicatum]
MSIKLFLNTLAILATAGSGEVTISLSNVPPLSLDTTPAVRSAKELFRQSCPEEVAATLSYKPELLMSSYADFLQQSPHTFVEGSVYPSSDSIVRGAVEAWAQHQHLVLRADEVWFEVLAQMNFYMTAHAEDIRHLFVTHEGKQEIQVWELTWRDVIAQFGSEIQKRVLTDWLLDWIMPGFSTSTENDGMTATVLMMGLMQHYFEFSGGIICGLPKVTLLGEKADWEKLLQKLSHLPDFGKEPAQYARQLRPIFNMFVRTWDDTESEAVKSFWSQMVRAKKKFSCGSGPTEYNVSGWITGLLHWLEDGSLRVQDPGSVVPSDDTTTLGNVTYAHQALAELPTGYAKAPLKMLNYPVEGKSTQAYLLAGNIGVMRRMGEDGWVEAQPLSSWFMYAPVKTNETEGRVYGSLLELQVLRNDTESCLSREEHGQDCGTEESQ